MHISPMQRMHFIRRHSTITLTSGKSHITLISLILFLSQMLKILATAWFTQKSKVFNICLDNGIISVAYNMNAKQYDLNSCNVTSSH